MPRLTRAFLVAIFVLLPLASVPQSTSHPAQRTNKNAPKLHLWATRSLPLDLEVQGDLAGMFPGTKRYLRRRDLLALPQTSLTVTDDPNFVAPVNVRGVELEILARELATAGEKALIVAVSDDWYRAYYPQAYREIHRPVLVLEINGQPPPRWPKSPEGASMGPYLITYPHFAPSFKILSHEEQPEIPWAVVHLDFEDEKTAFAAIAPTGPHAPDPDVQAGYRVAQLNCLRCHAAGEERTKGTITWSALGAIAAKSPRQFAAYVKDPKSFAPSAEMPGNRNYDDATLQALTAYFRTFAATANQ